MSVFSVKSGDRVNITTQGISLVFEDFKSKSILCPGEQSFYATATDNYRVINGKRNRLFIDISIDTGASREIWLTDGPTVLRGPNKEIIGIIDDPQAEELESWPDVVWENS